ncbi:MAG: DUF4271 domain-containing protein [Chitinophagaceae bacterium]
MNRIHILIFLLFAGFFSNAQVTGNATANQVVDSLKRIDSFPRNNSLAFTAADSISSLKRVLVDSTRPIQQIAPYQVLPLEWSPLSKHPQFNFKKQVTETFVSSLKQVNGKEILFYLIVFLLIIFAIVRSTFPKYFNDLFRLFFRRTLKQKQVREQLMQTAFPSLLMNGFFVIVAGLYLSFILQHFKMVAPSNFWFTFLYSCLGLSAAYFIKFAGLKIFGWLFNMEEVADSYIFIVFVVNKMIGILLIPFLLIIAFSTGEFYSVGLTFSWILIALILIYRIIMTLSIVRNEVKINLFHFLIYVCAFEIAPLLLVYKALLIFFNQTT